MICEHAHALPRLVLVALDGSEQPREPVRPPQSPGVELLKVTTAVYVLGEAELRDPPWLVVQFVRQVGVEIQL